MGRPANPGRNSQYPFLPGAEPKFTLPSGHRGVGSTGRIGLAGAAALPPPLPPLPAPGAGPSCAKKGIAIENSAKAADAVPIRVLLTQEIGIRVSYLKPICWPEGRTSLVFPTAPTQFNVGSLPSAPFVTLTVSPIFTVSFFQPPRMRA